MHIGILYKLACFLSAALVLSNCAYISTLQQRAHLNNLANNITPSSLQAVERFTNNAPIRNSYKFDFIDSTNKSYSLLFSIHESNFNKSTLTYGDSRQSQKDAERIDASQTVLKKLQHKLPKENEIAWQKLTKSNIQEAESSYKLMLEYIRFKSREI